MQALTKAQKARVAIKNIKIITDALALRGYYKPGGRSGHTLSEALKMLSPEIYGTMNDPRVIELKGLEYVVERLPAGIEKCKRIILTAKEDFEDTSFEKILPPKRRRTSYRVNEKEICFIISRGLSEIYDILTHLTFLNNEAEKIYSQMKNSKGKYTREWEALEKIVEDGKRLDGDNLDQALWNLSIILGRTFHEARDTFAFLEKYSDGNTRINILFNIIYGLGKRVDDERMATEDDLVISFTPSLQEMIVSQNYGKLWATDVKDELCRRGLHERPIHIISANMHSILNLIYGYGAFKTRDKNLTHENVYDFIPKIRDKKKKIKEFALSHGMTELKDRSGTHIDCQIIDLAKLDKVAFHPDLCFNKAGIKKEKPVIIVMDYAFGTQAFEAMDEILCPLKINKIKTKLDIRSISIMGKAGILTGSKGDVMLATAHVFEGTSDNYIVKNDLSAEDFKDQIDVYTGPIVTVVGTSLQNIDLLKRFQTTSWNAVGLEMEGGYYQKAISSAIIRGHIPPETKTRYAYYASDNPLVSGQTLASGSMGEEGLKPTYLITKVILEKILCK